MNKLKINTIKLKEKLINSSMHHGKKKTAEKIIMKSLKLIQKSSRKSHKDFIKDSIINSTPTFKMNQQSKKRGKLKTNKEIPSFIRNDYLRVSLSLRFLLSSALKNKEAKSFYKKITQEILESALNRSNAIEKKTEVQNQVLLQKRYLLNFRW